MSYLTGENYRASQKDEIAGLPLCMDPNQEVIFCNPK